MNPRRSRRWPILLLSAVFFSAILFVPQLMEKILGYSALEAGVGVLPMLGTFGAVAFLSDRITARTGMRPAIIAGVAMLAAGGFAFSHFGTGSGYAALLAGLVLVGIGAGLLYPTVTTTAVGALDESRSSLAGGIAYMFGVLVGTEPGWRAFAEFSGTVAEKVLETVRDSFVAGVQLSFRVVGVIAFAGLVVAILGIKPEATEAKPG